MDINVSYIIVNLVFTGLCMWMTWCVARFIGKKDQAADAERYKYNKTQVIKTYNRRIELLTAENTKLKAANETVKKRYATAIRIAKAIKKSFDIKATSAKGLDIAVKQLHNAYQDLETKSAQREAEHQKEIEDLTRYYQEKLGGIVNERTDVQVPEE